MCTDREEYAEYDIFGELEKLVYDDMISMEYTYEWLSTKGASDEFWKERLDD